MGTIDWKERPALDVPSASFPGRAAPAHARQRRVMVEVDGHRETRTAEAAFRLDGKRFDPGRNARPDVADRPKQAFRDGRPHDG
ncbi:hypothetical protein [Sphingomonas colocasiae]|uniref:Uncharacterized protein n=1 Tax=Sphingomonas colocasiae TaxID=1848973 RepID=A0ABS7PPM3_9SPHN|nr:hypothetical protein [Sphingomonas colocasiae]MBY8823272.1 hypothetical protein [Sphingomonas colocasiae]